MRADLMAELMSRRVLVIGDNPPTRDVLKSLLFSVGVRSLTVETSTEESLERVSRGSYDAAFIDCDEVDDGTLSTVRRLRAALGPVPMFMLAGRQRPAALLAAKNAGVDGVLAKPVAPDTLARRLAQPFRSSSYVLLEGFAV